MSERGTLEWREKISTYYGTLEQRLLRHVEFDPNGGCWLWSGGTHDGYGRLGYLGKTVQAHRASWIAHRGPVPHGLVVCHKCDVRQCLNPDHLFLGTIADNNHDAMSKGRNKVLIGSAKPNARLSEADIPGIFARHEAGESARSIAESLGVVPGTVANVLSGLVWTHARRAA